jgi:Zn-dependent protease with chaperone function
MEPDSGLRSSSSSVSRPAADPGFGKVIVLVAALMAVLLLLVLVAVAAVVPALPWWSGVPVAVVAPAVLVWLRLRDTVGGAVARLGGAPADEAAHARLVNLVQGLALSEGVMEPELYVVDDPARNLAAVAQGDRSALVATTGLLTALDRIALEGAVAGALVRIGSGDAEAATLGTALFGPLVAGPIGALSEPVVAAGHRLLLADDRDLIADRAAVRLTRYPPGLREALESIRSGTARPAASTRADHHLWMVSPVGAGGDVIPRASLDLRMDVLSEL